MLSRKTDRLTKNITTSEKMLVLMLWLLWNGKETAQATQGEHGYCRDYCPYILAVVYSSFMVKIVTEDAFINNLPH